MDRHADLSPPSPLSLSLSFSRFLSRFTVCNVGNDWILERMNVPYIDSYRDYRTSPTREDAVND